MELLGSQKRKKKSRRVVAKRQAMEKSTKIEQRTVQVPEWGPQVEQTALLASSIYIQQAQGKEKTHKKRSPRARSLSLSLSLSPFLFSSHLLGWHVHTLRMYFPLFSKWNWAVTWSCNTVWELWCTGGFNVHHFKFLLWRDRTEEIIHSPDRAKVKTMPSCECDWWWK